MAKAWKDVIASPQYQALAPEQKAQAQEQYFNEVVAPQAGESVEQAKQAFYAAYPLPSTNEIDRSQSATQNIQHTSSDNSIASGYAKLATQQREGLERSAEQGA
ncbi:TPA: injection protein, partial [Escherichia coli]|nr:injection protein [Escherichia coli]